MYVSENHVLFLSHLQHLLQLLIRGSLARDLQLTSNLLLALLSVINLKTVLVNKIDG